MKGSLGDEGFSGPGGRWHVAVLHTFTPGVT